MYLSLSQSLSLSLSLYIYISLSLYIYIYIPIKPSMEASHLASPNIGEATYHYSGNFWTVLDSTNVCKKSQICCEK